MSLSTESRDSQSPRFQVDAFGHSHVGHCRKLNDDSYLCLEVGEGCLVAVADGMGGHAGGRNASELAIEALRSEALRGAEEVLADSDRASALLNRAFQAANRAVLEGARRQPELRGMGTTLTAALLLPDRIAVANVGDSRAYLSREGRLFQITEDHSWKAEQRRLGELSEEEMQRSPFRETITRCIGFEETMEVDLFEGAPLEGDRLLLCSDGLHDLVAEEEIGARLLGAADAQAITRALVDRANENGGRDNVTCVVALVRSPGGGASDGASTADTQPLDLTPVT